nr:beta-ketoacyl-ACP synthase III [uncultured Caproiciproducens sp.]
MSFNIIGTGSAFPACSKTNEELSLLIDTSDEWISTRTGIKSRHISTTETLTDFAAEAARRALDDASTAAGELDLIICSTARGDHITPSLACEIQERLGATCPAFDLNAACTGFVYALDVAFSYFSAHRAKKILIVAAEAMSKLLDWQDRSTCVLFGDGAGAAVLAPGDSLLSIKIGAKGEVDPLYIENTQGNCPYSQIKPAHQYLKMNGKDVYKFAVSSMCGDLADVIREAGLTQDDIDYVLPHQANLRIIEAAKSKLSIAPEKYRFNIDRFGNTSSASIPVLLDEMNRAGELQTGNILALTAFGGGMTTGACIIRWSGNANPDNRKNKGGDSI